MRTRRGRRRSTSTGAPATTGACGTARTASSDRHQRPPVGPWAIVPTRPAGPRRSTRPSGEAASYPPPWPPARLPLPPRPLGGPARSSGPPRPGPPAGRNGPSLPPKGAGGRPHSSLLPRERSLRSPSSPLPRCGRRRPGRPIGRATGASRSATSSSAATPPDEFRPWPSRSAFGPRGRLWQDGQLGRRGRRVRGELRAGRRRRRCCAPLRVRGKASVARRPLRKLRRGRGGGGAPRR
mmetsp:Transcript_35852/g.107006  ORF Transcript_35852/g.107006 Transcript_35852/m.107006 type:complete len:238 (-) Transcript_35852:1160-1873(-)